MAKNVVIIMIRISYLLYVRTKLSLVSNLLLLLLVFFAIPHVIKIYVYMATVSNYMCLF